ncbi:MAG: hypothetical protein LBH18_05740 [Spirochaetaceae bacterium]|jgi:hypothetical protein|nr:hypothetical protein [Spirochaetaceae bacterium]
MANKKLCGTLAVLLAFGALFTGCATIGKQNIGSIPEITAVPVKDFTSLGIVQTENFVENNKGDVFTYYELLKQAKGLGADAIVNVTIDVKREGIKFLWMYLNPKETWYGSATAIKWADGLLTPGSAIMSSASSSDGGGLIGSESNSSTKKWWNPFTWFK